MRLDLDEICRVLLAYREACVLGRFIILPLLMASFVESAYRLTEVAPRWLRWVRYAAWYGAAMANGVGVWLILKGD